ncbi:MAG: lamin tail domain-containing protein, partial [Verrucomicrobiota bacterium]
MKFKICFSALAAFLLPLAVAEATPVISEFMASGSEAPADADGNTPDWIEIHNPDQVPVNLSAYSLTDDQENLQKWTFPEVTLEPQGYLIVFASGKDRREGEWHTNFELNGGGEFLAFSAPDGMILSEFTYPE